MAKPCSSIPVGIALDNSVGIFWVNLHLFPKYGTKREQAEISSALARLMRLSEIAFEGLGSQHKVLLLFPN